MSNHRYVQLLVYKTKDLGALSFLCKAIQGHTFQQQRCLQIIWISYGTTQWGVESNRVLSLVDLPLLATNIDASSMGYLVKLSNPSLNTVMEQSQHVYYMEMPNMDKRRTKRDKEKEREMSNGSLQISYSEISVFHYQLLLQLKLIFYNLEIYNMMQYIKESSYLIFSHSHNTLFMPRSDVTFVNNYRQWSYFFQLIQLVCSLPVVNHLTSS